MSHNSPIILVQNQVDRHSATQAKELQGVFTPTSWIAVKKKLLEMATKKKWISYEQYLDLCEKEGEEKDSGNLHPTS